MTVSGLSGVPDGASVLMIHRNTRPDDLHYGKYNGLGGKLDSDEDVATGMRREIHEEAGIFLPSAKRELVQARLSRRLRELGLKSFYQYYRQIAGGDDYRAAALGHPRVYMQIDEKGYVDCGYCDRRFILKGGPADLPGDNPENDSQSGGVSAS